MSEMNHSQHLKHQQRPLSDPLSIRDDDNRELFDLVSRVPESVHDEEELSANIDSQITMTESERQSFMASQPQLFERTNSLSMHDMHVLEDRWIDKIHSQWTPILSYMERQLGRKEVLQSLLDADEGKGSSVLDGQSVRLDLPITLKHIIENGGITTHRDSKADLAAVLKIWKRSLQILKDSSASKNPNSGSTAAKYMKTLETLSKDHSQQLEGIQKLKKRLEARLKEASLSVERLQREQKIKKLPYRRLLSTIPIHDHGGDLEIDQLPEMEPEVSQDAIASARHISTLFGRAAGNQPLSPPHIREIRDLIHETAQQNQDRGSDNHEVLREMFESNEASGILTVRQAPIATPCMKSVTSRQPNTETAKPIYPSTKPEVSLLSRTLSTSKLSIRPPASIRGRFTAKPSKSIISDTLHDVHMDSAKSSVRSSPECLIMSADPQDSNTSGSSFKEVISLITTDSPTLAVPFKPETPVDRPGFNSSYDREASPSTTHTQQSTNSGSITPAKRRSNFLSSIFSRNGVSKDVGTEKQNTEDAPLSQSNMGVANSHTQEATSAPLMKNTKPLSPTQPKPTLRQNLGISRRKSLSRDLQSKYVVSSRPRAESIHLVDDEEIVQQMGMINVFDMDGLPGTPSKRRRVDSADEKFGGRRASFSYDIEVPLNDDVNYKSKDFFSRNTPKRAGRSPELTVEDLRTITPKPLKTNDTDDNTTMPLMLLHTPQQRKLFGMDKDQAIAPANPFPTLTPPSTSDTELVRRAMTSAFSPKRSQFSSSIFSRFRTGVTLQTMKNLGSSGVTQSGGSPPLTVEASPFIVSPDTAQSPFNSRVGQDRSQTTTSSSVKHLLTGNSVVHDTVRNETSQRAEPSAPSARESTFAVDAEDERDGTNVASIRIDIREDGDDKDDGKGIVISEPSPVRPDVDFRVSRNPWGRPPSWKPKSPSMVDIEKKRQAERALRRAAKGGRPKAPSFESFANTSLDPFRASAHGQVNISVPSSSFMSFTSSSTTSSQSDSGHLGGHLRGTIREETRSENAELESRDDGDDTQEYNSPPVSPIRILTSGSFPFPAQ
ncbi:hypothetical protein BGX34_008400 [Mortierella sp. NVP85]|nr:hypothetical protein BGX34_008400 [Mortierella sp. NVP85]